MAKTVGLPAAIAVKMILDGSINKTGVVIPVFPEIYNPVLEELKLQHGIDLRNYYSKIIYDLVTQIVFAILSCKACFSYRRQQTTQRLLII